MTVPEGSVGAYTFDIRGRSVNFIEIWFGERVAFSLFGVRVLS